MRSQSGLGFRGVGLLNHIQVVSTLITPLADVSIEVGDGGTVIGVQPEGQFGPETERGRLDGSRHLISRIIVVLQNKRGLSASRISGEIALDSGACTRNSASGKNLDDRSLVEVGDGYGESLGNCIDSIRSLHRNFISVVGSGILRGFEIRGLGKTQSARRCIQLKESLIGSTAQRIGERRSFGILSADDCDPPLVFMYVQGVCGGSTERAKQRSFVHVCQGDGEGFLPKGGKLIGGPHANEICARVVFKIEIRRGTQSAV